ncbi:Casein kinase II, beta subunit [Pseudoloma neurophilia]|uniref:Casein kinase II subunit beta n=1 Tax=Pseudoloma neurophilia TaxID=146866 RepID=A0A0R0LY59_9MICR|nr:Casein kinase II, beta subunit [Pseudoloma neurophilia]
MKKSSSSSDSFTNSDSDEKSEDSWIGLFLKKPENIGLLHIQETFLADKFNLVGLLKYVPNLNRCFDTIKGISSSKFEREETLLYYLLHQRYVLTMTGMAKMCERIMKSFYGECRRMGCEDYPLIPFGLSNNPRISSVKLYCNNCNNVFDPENSLSSLDGCAFGNTFPHLLTLTYKDKFTKKKYGNYVPRIFGFKIYSEKDAAKDKKNEK